MQFFQPIIAGAIRHLFTTLAGILVAKGYLGSDQVASFVGSSMFFVGFGWSCWQKINTAEVLAHLTARQQSRILNAKRALVEATAGVDVMHTRATAAMLPILTGAIFGLVLIAAPYVHAQTTMPLTKPVAKRPIAKPPMHAGLLGLPPLIPGQSQPTPIDQLFGQIQQASITDLEYAIAVAQKAASVTPPTAASTSAGVRAQCYTAILGILTTTSSVQASTGAITAPTAPTGLAAAFTRFEQTAQVADQLAPMSSVMTACAPVAQAIRMNTTQLVLGILGGGLGLAKLGVGIP